MARVSHTRLEATLAQIEPRFAQVGSYDELAASAFSDAWQLIDIVHRVRELAQQNPAIREREPKTQVFLRSTKSVEDLRHYVQHFRSGIGELPAVSSPIFGFLSWVSALDDQKCFIAWSGTILPATETWSCFYDRVDRRFVQRLLLRAGTHTLDLDQCVSSLEAYEGHLRAHPKSAEHMSAPLAFAYSCKIDRETIA